MTKEDLLVQLNEMKSALATSLEEKSGKNIDAKLEAVNASIEELKGAKPEVTADELKAVQADLAATIKAFDMFQVNSKNKKVEGKTKSFGDALGEALLKFGDKLKGYKNDRQPINMELKAVGNMVAGNLTISGTSTFAGADYLGLGRKPYEAVHVRNIPGINLVPISTDSAYVIRDAGGEGGPTATAMGGSKPQSDRDYVKLIVPVTKIAHYFKIPEEMLEDNAWLQNEITAIGVEELMAKEDDLLLNQSAGSGLFAGLTQTLNSTAFAAPTALALGIKTPNKYDVLVAAWTQLQTLKSTATAILVNPQDYAGMILGKSTTGEYLFGAPNATIPNVGGIPVIPSNNVTVDKFIIGDFSKVKLGQRAGVSVRFYDQNEDDAIKNMVTVVIEERLTMVVDRADRFVYGDFSDAVTALTAP